MQFKSFLLRFKTVKRIYAIKRLQSVAIWRNDTIGKILGVEYLKYVILYY